VNEPEIAERRCETCLYWEPFCNTKLGGDCRKLGARTKADGYCAKWRIDDLPPNDPLVLIDIFERVG